MSERWWFEQRSQNQPSNPFKNENSGFQMI